MVVYKPFIEVFYKEDLKELKKGKFINPNDLLKYEQITLYSTKENAYKKLESYIKEIDTSLIVTKLGIEELDLDSEGKDDLFVYYYNKDLNFIDKICYSKKQKIKKPIYNIGEWVLFEYNKMVTIGLIFSQGKDEEPYLVSYEDSEIEDCSPHSHSNEIDIIRVLSEERSKELLPYKYFYNLKRRLCLYNNPKLKV